MVFGLKVNAQVISF